MASLRTGFEPEEKDGKKSPSPVIVSERPVRSDTNSTEGTSSGVYDEKHAEKTTGLGVVSDLHDEEHADLQRPISQVATPGEIVTQVLAVDDDPTLNPWTFRMWFLGIGLGLFGSVLATIYYFKPQTLSVSVIFLAVISYVIGMLMEKLIPKHGWVGRWFNPHPFNQKEHAAIVIMASSASTCALGTEVLAVQRLWYTSSPNAGVSIFLLFSSQLLGYGIAGLLRSTLVYPTKMLYPVNLPLNTLLEMLHRDKKAAAAKLRYFYWLFGILFVWEVFPQYMMPVMTGVSVFCLSNRKSLLFTNLFGGSNGNEGLGFLSLSLDWQYIAGTASPLWFPLQTLVNNFIGYLLCIVVFMGVFYGNVWRAQDFPFLSQLLFSSASNATEYVQYNQTAILGPTNELDPSKLEAQGIPYFASTYVTYLISTNLAIMATFTHLMLWNYDDIKQAWSFITLDNLKTAVRPSTWTSPFKKSEPRVLTQAEADELDPHYRLMLAYDEVPNWWYMLVLCCSIVVGIICLYQAESTLPWWGFLIACALSGLCILFFGAQFAITGFTFIIQPIIQMLGGYLHAGKPVANMYFTLFGYNSVSQGMLLLRDLKLAQYSKLSPKCTFTAQFTGTIIGSILNYIMMSSIVSNQREILLSVEGTNIWSGQNVQQYNSQAIAWGALAKEMFSVGGRYQWVTLAFLVGFAVPVPFYILHRLFPRAGFHYWNTAIIAYNIGWLCVGINSSIMSFFIVGFFSQFYLRKYRPEWFIKYNYITSAAMDGGTQVIVFILTFAVSGGSGKAVKFPLYWGNNAGGNFDYCMQNPAN
ncbi:MAG: hypothetical protein M1838_001929 [Thelocarpon superellum]|nr:MAG: hypothetical protein M1838_001929 [Thelocarpon superellum]